MNLLKPNKTILMLLFAASFGFIAASFLLYKVFIVGHIDCGSKCSDFSEICPTVCIPYDIPNPLYAPFLLIGVILLIISIIYSIYFLIKRKSR